MRDGGGDIALLFVYEDAVLASLCIVDIRLCALCNASHSAHCLYGIGALGCLTGKHDGGSAVIDGIRHVGRLCSGGTGIVDHGIQHLGSGDNDLALVLCLFDHLLLQHRYSLHGHFHAQVASGYHDAVCHVQDLVQIFHALSALDLSNDLHLAAVLTKELTHLHDVLCGSGKGGGDDIKAQLAAKDNVLLILFADKRHGKLCAGNVDALVIGNGTAVYHGTLDLCVDDLVDVQFDQTVIDEDGTALRYILGQSLEGNGSPVLIAQDLLCRKRKLLTSLQQYLAVLKIPQTDLRSLGIKQCGNGKVHFLTDLHQSSVLGLVLCMIAMGKIKSGYVHACIDQLPQLFLTFTGRSDGTHDLCFTHTVHSFLFVKKIFFIRFIIISQSLSHDGT